MITSFEGQSPLITWISCKFTRLIFPNLIATHACYKQDLIKKLKIRKSYKYKPKIYFPQRIIVSMLEYFTENSNHAVEENVYFFGHWQIIFLLYGKFFQTFFVCWNSVYPSCFILDNPWGSPDKSKLTLAQQTLLTKFLFCSFSTFFIYLSTYTHNITFKLFDSLFNSIAR